jgi:hypothetical protein
MQHANVITTLTLENNAQPGSSTTVTGHLTLVDLAGKVRAKLKAHGGLVNGAQSSEVIRDLAIVDTTEHDGRWRVVSVGYDGRVVVTA